VSIVFFQKQEWWAIPQDRDAKSSDATTAAEKQEAFAMVRQAMEEIMARHNTAFLNSF
jgi:hypothetical protein